MHLIYRATMLVSLLAAMILCAACDDQNAIQPKGGGTEMTPATQPSESLVFAPDAPRNSVGATETLPDQAPPVPVATANPEPSAAFDDNDSQPLAMPVPAPAAIEKPLPAKPVELNDSPMLEGKRVVQVTPDQLALIDSIQQKNLRLLLQLTKTEKEMARMKSSLVEARETAGQLQSEINRKNIEVEINKRELANLKEKLSSTSQPVDDKTAPLSGKARENLLDLMNKLKQLQRDNEKLQYQLKLAQIDEKDERLKTLLSEVEKSNQALESLEASNKKLSHRVVEQAGAIEDLATKFKSSQQSVRSRDDQIGELAKKLDDLQRSLQSARKQAALAQSKAQAAEEARIEAEKIRDRALSLANRNQPITRPDTPTATHGTPLTPAAPEPVSAAQPTEPEKPKTLTGKITDINEILLTVNVGKDDGIRKGMRLIVYRDDRFIGYLQIDKVLASTATGMMTRQIINPKVGDNVIDRLD